MLVCILFMLDLSTCFYIGIVPVEEPFKKVIHQGMILNAGHKMAKSKGNAISPDDYDADELRLYLMFIGHYFDGGSWSDQNIKGIQRFIQRFAKWMNNNEIDVNQPNVEEFRNECFSFAKSFKFNKVISTMMSFINKNHNKGLSEENKKHIIDTVEIFAPGIRNKI